MIESKNDEVIGYSIEDNTVEGARNCTVMCNGYRFRIFVEVVTSCYGNCTGCSLSYEDRRTLEPEMSIEQIKNTFNYFVPIINNNDNIRTSVLTLGTGDYFLMEDKFLEDLFYECAQFFNKVKTQRNVLTFSTSLFLNEEKMKHKIGLIKKHLNATQFAVEGVIDPLQLDKHYDTYLNNYHSIVKYFPFFDLVVNISSQVKPGHIRKLAQFLKDMGILNFDLQYAINGNNVNRVKTSVDDFKNIVDEIYEVLGEKTHDILEISVAMPDKDKNNSSIFYEMEKQAHFIVSERVMVKANGNIYPIAFGYGDIFLDERYGYPPIGNINKPWDPEAAKKQIFGYLKKLFITHKECQMCEYNKHCYNSGYAFYNNFNKSGVCENVGRPMLERIVGSD